MEQKFKEAQSMCIQGKRKEVRRAGKRNMLAIDDPEEGNTSEPLLRRIASVAVPPKGTAKESEERCCHERKLSFDGKSFIDGGWRTILRIINNRNVPINQLIREKCVERKIETFALYHDFFAGS
jgi:hypothetical protein